MYNRDLKGKIGAILENEYKLDIGTTEKVIDMFFSTGYIPRWYFYSNSPKTIARNIYLYTQLLSANSRYLKSESDDGKTITYFVNVGRDTPGRLEGLIEENIDMGIGTFDAEYTKSGISILSISKKGRSGFIVPEDLWSSIKNTLREAEKYSKEMNYEYGIDFLNNIGLDYLSEEVTAHSPGVRLYRHMEYYEQAIKADEIVIFQDYAAKKVGDIKKDTNEKRLAISIKNPTDRWVIDMLKIVEEFDFSMNRVYYDLIEGRESVGILSIYMDYSSNIDLLVKSLKANKSDNFFKNPNDEFNIKIDNIIRALTTLSHKEDSFKNFILSLKELCHENGNINVEGEFNNFYLNSVTDFFKAAEFIGIDNNIEVLSVLLGYEGFDEFFVSCRENNVVSNKPGFRAKHNSARGPSKGGLRIDSIVKYDEVAALSFMMTWKCARSRILFGGGKGGLKLNPRKFAEKKIDFFDTLSNFGRSIFCVTGPTKDVPAGDVGCGAKEIGHLFEGFKSALRDLALLAYGVKKGVALIGNNLISTEEARKILFENFDIDYLDKDILRELSTTEEYLNLVAAAQITGKPKMGINARTGATGRGLCYSILQTVSNLYLQGEWTPSLPLTKDEDVLIEEVCKYNERSLNKDNSLPLITTENWTKLNSIIYIKLLKGKKVVVQGSGKVGSSIMKELSRFEVNFVGVADAGGAITGDNLDLNEILNVVNGAQKSVIGCKNNVVKEIIGANEGSEILTIPCDIVIPAALENAITQVNAYNINCKIVACGSNGPCSSKAEQILSIRGITVIYDFLANGAGVTASYFEWLRNLYSRFLYEAIEIRKTEFDFSIMDKYIMPEFKERIKKILLEDEGDWTTLQWNLLIRDIIFVEINDDFSFSKANNISLKTSGFVNSILRVLVAVLVKSKVKDRYEIWNSMNKQSKILIKEYFKHPEVDIFTNNIGEIKKELFT